ncbi:hypothetical protein L9F63_019623, partial [Diploptera punctata]
LWYCQQISKKIDCKPNPSYPKPHVKHKNICVHVNDTGPCEMWNIGVDMMDDSNVYVTFNVTSNNCSCYKFLLKVNNSMDEMSCNNQSGKYITNKHSEFTVSRRHNDCDQVVNITFENIFTGCYKLYYCTQKSELNQKCGKLVKYFNTVKQDVEYNRPTIISQPNPENNEVGITLANYTRFDEVQLTVRPDNSSNCNSSNVHRQTIWISRDVSRELMCRRNSDCQNDMEKKTEGDKCKKIECYEESENSIKCEFNDIKPGNYCVHMIITDQYCDKNCAFHHPFVMMEKEKTIPIPESSMSIIYFVISAVIFLLLITSIVIVFIIRRRRNSLRQVVIADDDRSWFQNTEILLLYPRDCKAFMCAMETLREILQEKTGCKVYDCFDTRHSEDLSLSKVDWLRKHVLHQNVKIIVVETVCAVLHQRALIQHNKLIYKEPVWLDDLFLFGLKLLTDNLDRNNYQKVFVIRVEGFSGEKESLDYLTPYTRYMIPQCLDLLLTDLNLQNMQENIREKEEEEEEEEEEESLLRFEHDLNDLINYRTHNPEYLQHLLSLD